MLFAYLKKYWKFILGIIVIVLLVVFSFLFKNEAKIMMEEEIVNVDIASSNELEEKVSYIFVDIKGAVKKPGVYQLEEGSRVIHAIEKSGGLKSGADTSVLNLSKRLEDGNIIIVYTKDKIEEIKSQEKIVEIIEKECICPDVNNDACIEDENIIVENPNVDLGETTTETKKISLNKASIEELLTISGIGESKAKDIIEYRKQQKFEKIEDIKNVKGIGDALFEKIKEYITI